MPNVEPWHLQARAPGEVFPVAGAGKIQSKTSVLVILSLFFFESLELVFGVGDGVTTLSYPTSGLGDETPRLSGDPLTSWLRNSMGNSSSVTPAGRRLQAESAAEAWHWPGQVAGHRR